MLLGTSQDNFYGIHSIADFAYLVGTGIPFAIIGALIGLVVDYFANSKPNEDTHVKCPDCKELVLKDNLDSYNQKTLDSIIETASVSIHVRRGDYLNLGLELTNWNKYYSDALTYINCRHKIEKVFVFSDDVLWVKENIKTTFPIEYVSNHEKHQDNKDLILMSKCKYNIIANSTFSWWGAWLIQGDEKVVVYPNPMQADFGATEAPFYFKGSQPVGWIAA